MRADGNLKVPAASVSTLALLASACVPPCWLDEANCWYDQTCWLESSILTVPWVAVIRSC